MKLVMKRFGLLAIALAVMIAFTPMFSGGVANAKAKVKLNKKTVTVTQGKTYTLKVKGVKAKKVKKIKWKSSNTALVKVTKKGKLKAKLTAKKPGKVTITAKVKLKNKKKYKKLKCKVTVESKAKTLRNYILKNGTKSGDKRYISQKVYDSEVDDGTTWEYKITASSKDKNLVFDYSVSSEEPPDTNSVTMKINLIDSSKAVNTGTVECNYEDGYGNDSWVMWLADITTQFTHTFNSSEKDAASGITLKKYISNDDENSNVITDSATLNTNDYLRAPCRNITAAFKYWDKLMASKKPLKNAKITMKSIGFSKAKY